MPEEIEVIGGRAAIDAATDAGSNTDAGAGAGADADAVVAPDADRRANRARAAHIGTRFLIARRTVEERQKWLAENPIFPGMTQEQRNRRSKAKRAAFSRIERIFRDWRDSADRVLADDLKTAGRLPAELQPDYVPKIRLNFWGRCIRAQRVDQRLKAKDLCRELGLSEATLRRIEKGDPMVAVISYLKAMGRLGILTRLVPEPPDELWRAKDDWSRYCYRSRRPRDVPYSSVRRVRDPSPD